MSCNCKNRPEIGRGAAFCNCGEECRATVCEGCFKLHETQWLADYPDHVPTDIFEVRFKNTRRSFYQNVNNLPLETGDIVAVEASPGHDIGIVSLTGDMVAKQMKRTGFNPYNGEFKKIYRKAKPYDIERWQEAIALEHETMIRSRQIAADMGLNMKIGDVEYQGDKIKAIFYYIADERVDFRELIKVFAEQFHIRIEMKQIGARQEAGRIGGLGACGRELCCASWISSFSSVTTNTARMQELSLNPQKLAGQCSKLKCCLAYEYDTYADARRDFPRVKEPLQALDGEYYLVKSDILARTMQFSSSKDALVNVTTLSVERVKEIQALNRAGKKVDRLLAEQDVPAAAEEPTYRSEEDSITRFDQAKRRKRGGRNNKGLVTIDRKTRKESFYLYQAYWFKEPMVHIVGRRYAQRAGETIEVKVYSNQDEVTLFLNGKEIGKQQAHRIFRFEVALQPGFNTLMAITEDARDCITLEKVEKEPASYVLPEFTEHVEGVANWFQQVGSLDLDAPMEFPEGYYNVNDSLDELSHNEEAFAIVTKAVKLTTNFSIEPGVGMWDMLKKMSPKVMCEMMPDSTLGDKFLNSINAQLIKIRK